MGNQDAGRAKASEAAPEGSQAGASDSARDRLRALIGAGEGRRVEFKSGLPRDAKIARTLGAFANTSGGVLLVGVRDRGELCGLSDAPAVIERLHRVARAELEPPVELELRALTLDGFRIVLGEIPLSPLRPHRQRSDGRVLVRVGASNRPAVGATLRALAQHTRRRHPQGELERRILDWVEQSSRGAKDPGGSAGPDGFASAMNIGKQRARRAFVKLERDGLLVAYGEGRGRRWRRP